MAYTTPPGTDESFIEETETGHTRHKYLNGVALKGGKYGTKILDEIAERMNNNKSCVINVTGPPGIGKTYFAIALALLFDPMFKIVDTPAPPPEQDPSNMSFEREHIAFLIGDETPLQRGQVVIIDESHFAMGSRTFLNREQVEIVNLVAALRSKGFMVIMVTLHSTMLDKIPREHVVTYELSVRERGLAKIYLRYYPPLATHAFNKGKGYLELPLPDPYNEETDEGCDWPDCLRCEHLHPKDPETRCHTIRAIYERRKKAFIGKQSRKVTKTEKPPKKTLDEQVQLVHNEAKDLYLNRNKGLEVASIQKILEKHKEPHGEATARRIKNEYERKYPETITQLRILSGKPQ